MSHTCLNFKTQVSILTKVNGRRSPLSLIYSKSNVSITNIITLESHTLLVFEVIND